VPCYSPLRGSLMETPEGRRICFSRIMRGPAITLPCGKCSGCLAERARQWSVRIVHEASLHEASSFLTLTYSREFLPVDGSISVRECQLFLKRLRAAVDPVKIRFFLCGEYGEKLGRPHYHAIIFGFDFPDRVRIGGSDDRPLFRSDLLDRTWQNGFASIGSVTTESARYVANYSLKKVTGVLAAGHYAGRVPEFVLMSRRPGIGRGWIERFAGDVFPSDEVIVNGNPVRPPRYYDKFLERENPALLAELKAKRTVAVMDDPLRNDLKRLGVRRRVAAAKSRLKRRSLEES